MGHFSDILIFSDVLNDQIVLENCIIIKQSVIKISFPMDNLFRLHGFRLKALFYISDMSVMVVILAKPCHTSWFSLRNEEQAISVFLFRKVDFDFFQKWNR